MRIQSIDQDPNPQLGNLGALTDGLRKHVESFAYPRHYWSQRAANRRVGNDVGHQFERLGLRVTQQGPLGNIVALPRRPQTPAAKIALVCAHFDSVPTTPGADDNASGLAVALEVARLARLVDAPVGFVAFNGEEDDLAGSRDFVSELLTTPDTTPSVAHVLEMVGFKSTKPNSQRSPIRLPFRVPTVGDFIGVVANHRSVRHLDRVLAAARRCASAPKIVALKTYLGTDRLVPEIHRSDHWPFWRNGLPALMWTDTAEFRNPNYHQPSDTPDTLDYRFMSQVALLLAEAVGVDTAAALSLSLLSG